VLFYLYLTAVNIPLANTFATFKPSLDIVPVPVPKSNEVVNKALSRCDLVIGYLGIEQLDYLVRFVDFALFDDLAILKVLADGGDEPASACFEIFLLCLGQPLGKPPGAGRRPLRSVPWIFRLCSFAFGRPRIGRTK